MNYLELAKEIINKNYSVIGVRTLCDDEQYNVGDYCRGSYEWDIEADCSTYYTTGETANGTCATYIEKSFDVNELAENIAKAVEENEFYEGQQVIVVGNGVNNDGMFDPGEIRILNALVFAVL